MNNTKCAEHGAEDHHKIEKFVICCYFYRKFETIRDDKEKENREGHFFYLFRREDPTKRYEDTMYSEIMDPIQKKFYF